MIRKFTGWHMTAILVVFFAIVIAVNVTMARFAIGTFGGTVVDNSYVASQKFNGWLAKADKQAALGWKLDVRLDRQRHVEVTLAASSRPLDHARLIAKVDHPLGRKSHDDLSFTETAPGHYRSVQPLAPGRWNCLIIVTRGADTLRQLSDLQ